MQYLSAPKLFDGEAFHSDMAVAIEGETIVGTLPRHEVPAGAELQELVSGTLAPGFIDLQVNGGGGVMLNNSPLPASVDQITLGHRSAGTTGMMPTLISDTPQLQREAIAAVAASRQAGNQGVLGVHIEGPFFDQSRRGTHSAEMIRPLEQEDIDWLTGFGELAIMLTLAPEHTRPGQIQQLADAGIMVCAGHTDASYEQVQLALAEGLRGFTHLFNAMSPLQARSPGTVGAALDSDATWVGVIADGHHVHPASIRLAHRAKTAGKLVLVSDSMSTVGSEDKHFEIYGERIELRDGKLVNAEGSLAGSAIGMNDAVRYAHRQVGLPLEECLRMASLYPATFLALEHTLGRISAGYRADLVLFDDDFQVSHTWVAGSQLQHSPQT